jgi:hypothetical protein
MFKLPKLGKKEKGLGRMVVDPLGVGIGDAIFGAPEGPDYSASEAEQQAAMDEAKNATNEFAAGGPAVYSSGDNLQWKGLGPAEKLGSSALGQISTDPKYKEVELAALRDLEEQSKNGFTAADRADMAKVEASANRANRGRIGAIQQNMQARGMSGSGMDLVAQMQSAQDSAEIEAMRALETEARMQGRKQDATSRMGSLAGSLQSRDFQQEATKASAKDFIDRFNVQNSNENARYNNQGSNQATAQNWNRTNSTSDRNAGAGADFRKDLLGAKHGQAGMNYNYSVEGENRRRMADQAEEERRSGKFGALGGIAGGIIGGVYGGPQGASAGYQVGSGAGRNIGSNAYRNGYAHGGKVPGDAKFPGDDERNDTETVNVSPDEIILPRTVAKSPSKAAKFVAKENEKDAIGDLLMALALIHKGK